jgi:protein subunit release factor A
MELEDFSPEMIKKIADFKSKYNNIEYELDGNPARAEIGEWDKVTLAARIRIAMQGLSTSYGPTELNSSNLEIARKMFNESKGVIESLKAELESLENQIKELNPPHLSGSGIN